MGVLLYELIEHELPFGEDPQFKNRAKEYRPMRHKSDAAPLVERLLQWDASKRLGYGGSEEVMGHPYWGDAIEWDLVNKRLLSGHQRGDFTSAGLKDHHGAKS